MSSTTPIPPEPRQKVCGLCGQSFECCTGGCWCDDVTVSEAARESLRGLAADCVCPGCLRRHAAECESASRE